MKKPSARVVHAFLGTVDAEHEIDLSNLTTEETETMAKAKNQDPELEQAPDIVFTRLLVEGFRGIDLMELDLKEHPRGVVFAGTKAIGKTSSIRAIEADLWGAGIDKSAIKTDATGTKISLSFLRGGQELTAVRTISKSKTEAKLVPPDGIPLPKAVEQLRAMFGQGIGSGGRDPLRLYGASKEDLRKMLLQASPCAVTPEQLTRWCEEEKPWNVDGHGQEVLGRVKDSYFDRRTTAGQEKEKAEEEVATRENDVAKLRAPGLPSITAAAAQTHVAQAESALAVLHERRRQVVEREAAAEGTRAKVVELRAKAEELMARPEAVGPSDEEFAQAADEQRAANLAFEAAKLRLNIAHAAEDAISKRHAVASALEVEATNAITQANELEAAITGGEDLAALAEQVDEAEASLVTARDLVTKATQADSLREAEAKATTARATYQEKKAAWEKLDRIVKRLASEAPAELSRQGNPIPGLEILPKTIMWNGHDLELASDGEKLEFSVEVVKRTAVGAKVMVIDKLESLPPSLRPAFVRTVLRGGWVLFATLVQDGAMEVVDCYRLAQQAA